MPYETQETSEFSEVKHYGTEIADSGYKFSDFEIGDRVVCVGIWDDQPVLVGKEGVVRALNDDYNEAGVDFETNFGRDPDDDGSLHDLGGKLERNTGWWLPARMLIPVSQKPFEEELEVDFDSLFSESDMGYVALTAAAVCYGGVTAMIVGAAGCAIESIVLTSLGFSISWVFMNIIIGLIVGLVCFRLPDNRKWISIPTIVAAVAAGVVSKTFIECMLYSIPVAVKAPKALVAFAVDSAVMLLALPIAYTIKKRCKKYIY